MVFSVFDWNKGPGERGHYVYFEGPGEQLGVRPKPKRIWTDDRGHKLEDLLPVLPAGSRLVGRGDTPKGRIAILNDALRASLGDNPVIDHPWLSVLGWGAVIFVGYYAAQKLGLLAASPRGRKVR